MRSDTAPSRSTGLVATATTLVALVAVAASASAMRATEGRAAVSESQRACASVVSVRAMAAVAVALARDALGGEQHVTAHPPIEAVVPSSPARQVAASAVAGFVPVRAGPLLALLDLPPPIC